MLRFIRKLKLEFPSLNGLLHCILTYLRGEIALVPGAASIPEGTSIELNLTYPDADEPVVVRGVSQGLDPAGRGLRLRLDNRQDVDQVTMLLGHPHLGPYAARKLMAFVRQQQNNKPRLLSQTSAAAKSNTTEPPTAPPSAPRTRTGAHGARGPRSLHSERDRVLLEKASDGFRSGQRTTSSTRIQPPRMRPPATTGTSTAVPNRRTQLPGASTTVPNRRTQLPGAGSSSPRTELPQPAKRPAQPAAQQPAENLVKRRRRPPISSDRMPGMPKPKTPQSTSAKPSSAPKPAPGDGLDQTQMVRLDDMNADLGTLDDY